MILRTIIILLLAYSASAESSITHVSVHPGWAQVTRSVTAENSPIELQLPAWVDLGSIQAKGAAVLAIHSRLKQTPALSTKAREAREKDIEAIRKELTDSESRRALLTASTKTQREYFAKLMDWKLGAPPQEMTTRRFTDAEFAEFVKFRDVLADLDTQEYESQRAHTAIQERITEAETKLKEDLAQKGKEETIVSVDLAPGATEFTLEYRIPGATWHPSTEITPDGAQLRLTRRAIIRQITSEDWLDAKITLRTAQFGDPSVPYARLRTSVQLEDGTNPFDQDFVRFDATHATAREIAELATLLGERAEHAVAEPATILSGGSAVRMDIGIGNLPLKRIYSLNAQKRDGAWTKGEITPARNEMLGPLSVDVDEPFSVQWTNVTAAGDTLTIPLGEETRISVQRSLVREASDVPRASGDEKWLDLSYRLTVRNDLAESASIVLDESLPPGKVTVLGSTPQAEPWRSNALRWHLKLDAGETATFEYAIRWTYPAKNQPALATLLERALRP
ncbi:MAG: hypothetical protein ACI8W8_000544 [Rhodothermales bacterium]|jgi:hypothetical protein